MKENIQQTALTKHFRALGTSISLTVFGTLDQAVPVTEISFLRADFKNRLFARNQPDCRTTQIMQLMRGTAFDKKAVSMHQNQKIPDKVSRRSTALVRHFIQDTIVTFSKSLLA